MVLGSSKKVIDSRLKIVSAVLVLWLLAVLSMLFNVGVGMILSALFVLLRANDAFCLDLNIGTPTDRLAEGWRLQQRESLGAAVTWSEGDGLSYARLRFREGVEE